MTPEAIYAKLEEILKTVKPKMDPARISMDASLTTDLGIDSLSMLLLSLAIEHGAVQDRPRGGRVYRESRLADNQQDFRVRQAVRRGDDP